MMLLFWLFRIPCVSQGHEPGCVARAPSLGCKCDVRKLRAPGFVEVVRGLL